MRQTVFIDLPLFLPDGRCIVLPIELVPEDGRWGVLTVHGREYPVPFDYTLIALARRLKWSCVWPQWQALSPEVQMAAESSWYQSPTGKALLGMTHRRGRRVGSQRVRSGKEITWSWVCESIRKVRRNRDYPSQPRVWEAMGEYSDHTSLKRWHARQGLSWNQVLLHCEGLE